MKNAKYLKLGLALDYLRLRVTNNYRENPKLFTPNGFMDLEPYLEMMKENCLQAFNDGDPDILKEEIEYLIDELIEQEGESSKSEIEEIYKIMTN